MTMMARRALRAIVIVTLSALWSLPGSGCLPADSINSTVAEALRGQAPTYPQWFLVGWD